MTYFIASSSSLPQDGDAVRRTASQEIDSSIPENLAAPGLHLGWVALSLPVPEQGQWLGSVVRGHLAYYAVPTDAVRAFRDQAAKHWYRALRRRGQRTRLTWERMNRL